MAWSWSHTNKAYANAKEQLEHLDRETLDIIAAEWLAAIPHPQFGMGFHAELDEKKYHKSLIRVANWDLERLIEFIWPKIEELATCTNGGWEAHCCPFGCGPHVVPFDPVDSDAGTEHPGE